MAQLVSAVAITMLLGTHALAAPSMLRMTGTIAGAEIFVAPEGKPTGTGSRDSPWDIESVFTGKKTVAPGTTVWLLPGAYRHPDRTAKGRFKLSSLTGTAPHPIHISPVPGARVTLDGGLTAQGITHVWLWGIEITVSENKTMSRTIKQRGSHPQFDQPGGGLDIPQCSNCKFINLVIRDNTCGGIGFWSRAVDSEIYGCIITGNGWRAPDRGHGHCIYTQNIEDSHKIISNCIMWIDKVYGCYTMHAYTQGSTIFNYLIEENIAYHGGSPDGAIFLVGGGNRGSSGIRVERNFLYNVREMQIGHHSPSPMNVDCNVISNFVAGGRISVRQYEHANVADNTVVRGKIRKKAIDNFDATDNRINPRLPQSNVFLLPNKYDSNRAHLVIYNWARVGGVEVDMAPFITSGKFALRDPLHFFDKPAWPGTCRDGMATIPVGGKEFSVFVVLKRQPNGTD